MCQKVFFIKLLLVHYTTQQIPAETQSAKCNDDVSLRCPGIDGMNFLSVTWYKLIHERRVGIIRKGRADEVPKFFNFTRRASFGEKQNLFLPGVMANDSGRYECAISANVGGKNLNLKVDLIVDDTECMTKADPTTATNMSNTTQPDLLCDRAEDLPVMWSVLGYVAVALGKISLSLICIWVVRAARGRSSSRPQSEW